MFGQFIRGPLMEEEPAQGGGGAPADPAPAQPALPDFKALFGELKNDLRKELVKDFDARVNGINKETKKEREAFAAAIAKLESRLKTPEHESNPESEEHPANDPPPPKPEEEPKPPKPQPKPQKDPAVLAIEKTACRSPQRTRSGTGSLAQGARSLRPERPGRHSADGSG